MRYFSGILIGISAAAGIYAALFFASLGKTNGRIPLRISEWYAFKENAADRLPSPRIFIIAGSNGIYGIRAQRIEQSTGISTVNFSTQAGLSLSYLLDRPKLSLKAGDTVILDLEYQLYFPQGVNEVYSEFLLGADPSYFHGLSLEEQFKWIASSPFQTTVERLRATESKRRKASDKIHAEVGAELNDRGDFIQNIKSQQTAIEKQVVDQSPPNETLVSGNWNHSQSGWEKIRQFVLWCRERNIEVFATFPNTIRHPEFDAGGLEKTTKFMKKEYGNMGVQVLGDPDSFLFDKSDFLDTTYHLNDEGAAKRTDKLIQLLQPHLESIKSPVTKPK